MHSPRHNLFLQAWVTIYGYVTICEKLLFFPRVCKCFWMRQGLTMMKLSIFSTNMQTAATSSQKYIKHQRLEQSEKAFSYFPELETMTVIGAYRCIWNNVTYKNFTLSVIKIKSIKHDLTLTGATVLAFRTWQERQNISRHSGFRVLADQRKRSELNNCVRRVWLPLTLQTGVTLHV